MGLGHMPGYFISNVFVCIYIYLLLNTVEGKKIIRGYFIITMWPKPFIKLYLSSVYETLISQDWNFAIIASNLSFIVHIQVQLVYLLNTVGGLILLDMYYIITIGPKLSWSCIWFLHLHLSFISFKYNLKKTVAQLCTCR